MAQTAELDVVKFGRREVSKKEYFSPGHRACVGCAEALAVRLAMKAIGDNAIIVNATGCIEVVSSQLPYNQWKLPWIHTLFENTAAVASGVEAAIKILTKKGLANEGKTHVVAIGGDGGTADIGLQALSGMMERGHDVLYIMFDNEAYMNARHPALLGYTFRRQHDHFPRRERNPGAAYLEEKPAGNRRSP